MFRSAGFYRHFCFNFIGMRILALLLLFYCSYANAQDCSTLIKCYSNKCYQQDTVRGYDAGQKASIPKMWLSSSDTNYYLNIVFTNTVSGENIKLIERHDISFTFYNREKAAEGNKAYREAYYSCNYSGCVVHKIPLSKYERTAVLYSLLLQNELAYIELAELDRKQAYRDGDMVSDGMYERISECRISEAEWSKLKSAFWCMGLVK